MSVFSSFFSRDASTSFAYNISFEDGGFHTTSRGIALAHTYKKSEPSEKATCFYTAIEGMSRPAACLRASLTKLRQFKHPNMLTYLDSLESEKMLYLVTEYCCPLSVYMVEASIKPSQKDNYVCWGVYSVLNAVQFLHQDAQLSHNSLRTSVFVSRTGDWLLGGFELAQPFKTAKEDMVDILNIIWDIYNNDPAGASAERLLAIGRANNSCFRNKLIDAMLFLEEFQLKDGREKFAFLSHLKDQLDLFPEDIAKFKLLPKLVQLTQAFEFGDAGASVLSPLLQIGAMLDDTQYELVVVPCLVRLFASPDRATRVKLLEKLPDFVKHLNAVVVNEKIFGSLCTGFLDTNAAVREYTIKAMVQLAPKLNYQNLNVELMKHFARLQGKDDQGAIRTNTTICLGKLAANLHPNGRQKILVSAFTRAMKDPFGPARMAAVLAVTATQQYYQMEEVAHRILPALVTLTTDPDKQVRDHSFKSVHGFLDKLEKLSDNPDLLAEYESQVQVNNESRGGLMSSEKVPQWASWALASISGKFYKSASPSANKPPNESNQDSANTKTNTQPTKTGNSLEKGQSLDGWDEFEEPEQDSHNWGTLQSSATNNYQKSTKTDGNRNVNVLCDEDDESDWADQDLDGNSSDYGDGADDWGTNTLQQSQPSKASVPVSVVTAKTSGSKGGGGGLKLGSNRLKPSQTDDDEMLNELLGATSINQPSKPVKKPVTQSVNSQLSSSTALGPSGPISNKSTFLTKKRPQVEQTAQGWADDCDEDNGWTEMTSQKAGEEDDADWSSGWDTAPQAKPAAASRASQMKQRQELRRKELAEKRAAKPMRLGARKMD